MNVIEIVKKGKELGASDIHIVVGLPVRYRIDGLQESIDEIVVSESDCEDIGRELLGEAYENIAEIGEADFAKTFDGNIRCRINLFRQQGKLSAAIRILADKIPDLDDLGLPEVVKKFPEQRKGIVLITGETGSGKSTTLAALLDSINKNRKCHIITLEDPIEYIYEPKLATINQREIGKDTESYASGLKAILREDPDIILIGEMRDAVAIETALTAAETGHLVFSTLHTNSASDSIDRIVSVFPAEKHSQIRNQLSMTLLGIVSQQLLPKKNDKGRVLACEVMTVTSAIKALIRDGKTAQIANSMATSLALGNITMDMNLIKMVKENKISVDEAIKTSNDGEFVRKSVGFGSRMGNL